MNESHELETLQAAWREAGPPVPAGLRRRVNRQTWMIRLGTMLEMVVAIGALAGTMWLAMVQAAPEFVVLAVAVWMVTVTAAIYSLQNRAGTWIPATHDAAEFLRISRQRCRADLHAATLGLYLLLAQVLLLSAWHAWYWSSHSAAPPLRVWLLAACLPASFLAALLAFRSHRRREWKRIEAMERELGLENH